MVTSLVGFLFSFSLFICLFFSPDAFAMEISQEGAEHYHQEVRYWQKKIEDAKKEFKSSGLYKPDNELTAEQLQ